MPVYGSGRLVNPDAVLVSIELRMSLAEWEQIAEQLTRGGWSQQSEDLIAAIAHTAKRLRTKVDAVEAVGR